MTAACICRAGCSRAVALVSHAFTHIIVHSGKNLRDETAENIKSVQYYVLFTKALHIVLLT